MTGQLKTVMDENFETATEGKQESQRNSAALDQWRGLALLLVLFSHGLYFTHRVEGVGRVGVNLFFFISGILVFRSLNSRSIPGLLARAVSFWRRRFLRLFPALLAYLVAMIPVIYVVQYLLGVSGAGLPVFLRETRFALLFCVNYRVAAPREIGHLWSVSLEMQFYALGPLIYYLGGRGNRQRLAIWLVILLALMVTALVFIYAGSNARYHFQVAAWPMMLGFFCESQKAWINRLPRTLLLFGSGLGVFLTILPMALLLFGLRSKFIVVAGGSTIFVPCFFSYLTSLAIPGLAGRSIKWLGERTYSIYLWEEPFTLCNYLPNLWHPLGSLVSIIPGAISYHFFERPFLSAKRVKK
jgi:peptidoglycan/LPS O-acetylase OafA/YrhL